MAMQGSRRALVTGANRGLGLEVSRQLLSAGLDVVLTARRLDAAESAAARLGAGAGALENRVRALELDVEDERSVERARAALIEDGRGLDVLVNNAGVSLRGFGPEIVRRTLSVNFFGALRVTRLLMPLLSPRATIVMVSSGMGALDGFSSTVAARLRECGDVERVVALMREFGSEVEAGTHGARGWPSSAYSVSKAGLNALVRCLAPQLRELDAVINAVCPGWVRTDMGGAFAERSVEAGARSITWTALLPAGRVSGGFFRDGQSISF